MVGAAAACVSHPVGPARTASAYEGKARTTAESALSNVQAARLVAVAAADDRAFGPYTARVIGDAEESLGGLAGTFGSIQPPDDATERLRADLESIVGDAEDHVAALRIAARRGELHDLADLAAPLEDDIDALEHLLAVLA